MRRAAAALVRQFGSLLWISAVVAIEIGLMVAMAFALDAPPWFAHRTGLELIDFTGRAILVALPMVLALALLTAPIVPRLFHRIGVHGRMGFALLGGVTGALLILVIGLALGGQPPAALIALCFIPGSTAGLLWWLAVERPSLRLSQGPFHG